MYDGINDRNLSCPAVSQSCNRMPFESSKCTVFDKKSMPIVAWYVASNLSYMKREMTDVFPTDWSCCARIYACACVCVDHNKNISKSALCLSLSLTIEIISYIRNSRFGSCASEPDGGKPAATQTRQLFTLFLCLFSTYMWHA